MPAVAYNGNMNEGSVLEDVLADLRENSIFLFKAIVLYAARFTFLKIVLIILNIVLICALLFYLVRIVQKKAHTKALYTECANSVAEDLAEDKPLLEKCERLGIVIDRHTNRKHNSRIVAPLVYKTALLLGVKQKEAALYFCAALVYDAGFLDVNADLFRMEILSAKERRRIKAHVLTGSDHFDFLSKNQFTLFYEAANLHHENVDGSGYPEGLLKNDIPLIARILHVVESFVSLTHRRSYHKSLSTRIAFAELSQKTGVYDEEIIAALQKISKKTRSVLDNRK